MKDQNNDAKKAGSLRIGRLGEKLTTEAGRLGKRGVCRPEYGTKLRNRFPLEGLIQHFELKE